MTDATSSYLNQRLRSFGEAVVDLAAARRARGLPARPPRLTVTQAVTSARTVPAPGKRIGCRVFIAAQGVFGTVRSWKPALYRPGCLLAVSVSGMVYGVHEDAVEPAPDAA